MIRTHTHTCTDKNTAIDAQPTSFSQPSPSQSTTPTSMATPPLTESKSEEDIASSDPVTDPTTSASSDPIANPATSASTHGSSNSNDETTPSVKIPDESSSSKAVAVSNGGLSIAIEEKIPHAPEANCGEGDCRRDPGVISMVVVGLVCFIVLVIVAAVLLRKVYTDQRRKRFRNVDYLINGMYT